MHTRTLWVLTALSALAAQAQAPGEALAPPPLVSSEPEPCGVCADGAECLEGRCQFTCTRDRDCRRGLTCVTVAGTPHAVCEPKQGSSSSPIPLPGAADQPERFRYSRIVPPGFHVVKEPRWGLVAGGVATFAAAYLPFAILGPLGSRPVLAIPFFGPIANYRPAVGWFSGVVDFFHIAGIVIAVGVQAIGAGMIVAGFAAPTRWLERDAEEPTISFAPGAAGTPLGASVTGTF